MLLGIVLSLVLNSFSVSVFFNVRTRDRERDRVQKLSCVVALFVSISSNTTGRKRTQSTHVDACTYAQIRMA